MSSDHETLVCEHGRQITTCRCPSSTKTIVVSPRCPFACSQAGQKLFGSALSMVGLFAQSAEMDALPQEVQAAIKQVLREEQEAREAARDQRIGVGDFDHRSPVLITGGEAALVGLQGIIMGQREDPEDENGQKRYTYRVELPSGERHNIPGILLELLSPSIPTTTGAAQEAL